MPLPFSDPAGVDPEEAFVASLASCHLLWFLSLAAEQGWRVDAYEDAASGVLGRNAQGPARDDAGHAAPARGVRRRIDATRDAVEALHHRAHEACFIVSSVRSEVRCEPVHVEES